MPEFKQNQLVYTVDLSGAIRVAEYKRQGQAHKDGTRRLVLTSRINGKPTQFGVSSDRVYGDIDEAITAEIERQQWLMAQAQTTVQCCRDAIKRLKRKQLELEDD